MILEAKIINNVCLTTHPVGVVRDTKEQIGWLRRQPGISGAQKVLVVGGSGGFGLASRMVALFNCQAQVISVGFDKEPSVKRTGTPGWYTNLTVDHEAAALGLTSYTVNGDAFSLATKEEAAELIKKELGTIDLLVYSIASPVRQDPATGEIYRSVIKPIGQQYSTRGLDFINSRLQQSEILPASAEEVAATVKVMGGEDWQLWVDYLQRQNLLSAQFKTLSYSYIGPEYTHPIYKDGSIGQAKKHLQETAAALQRQLQASGGAAMISINKALVTRASAVIPAVSLYIAILYRVMKDAGLHEECKEQIYRLFSQRLYGDQSAKSDSAGLIRIDDWEMSPAIQAEVNRRWQIINDDNLGELADVAGYRRSYLNIHGFAVDGVDYQLEVDPLVTPQPDIV